MANRGQGGQRVDAAERRKKAVALKLARATWQQVADQCGYSSPAAALMDLKRYRAQLNLSTMVGYEQLRDEAMDELDRLQLAYWPKALAGDLDAANYVLKLIDKRSNITGINAPKNFRVALDARTDVEAAAVVESILAAADEIGLSGEMRMQMLEAAQSHLARQAEAAVVEGEVIGEIEA